MFELAILLLATLLNLFLGLIVFVKNNQSTTNKLFFGLSISLILWSLVNYFSTHPIGFDQLTWIRLTLFCGGLLNLAVFANFLTFPSATPSPKNVKRIKVAVLASILILPLTLTPLVFKSLNITDSGPQPVPNPGIGLFMLHTLSLLGISMVTLFANYRSARGKQRHQLGMVLAGIVGTFTLILFGNFLLVALFNITLFIPLGPAFTLIFTGAYAYAIIKHQLFDIRAAVARTVGYILSLGFIGVVYGGIVFAIFSVVDLSSLSKTAELTVFIALTLVTSTIFPITKKYFDQLTTKLFFQDSYDSQEFLDEINTLLVGQIELQQLLKGITDVIEQNLKSEYCVFVVRETAYEGVRIVGSENHTFNEDKIKELRSIAPHTHQKVLATDELASSDEQLKAVQDSMDIAVLIRLISNANLDTEGMGYLVLGPKKNGTAYTAQDRQVLNILANEMIIAVENALRFEEIEKFNVTLQDKVDSATTELKRTNEKLQEMDETKDEFISMASHQLRTPLTSVKGYLSMVLEGDVGKITKQQDKMLEQAFLSSQRMVYLIADLLNVSRLKTGKFIIDSKETNLADVVETEVLQLQPTAKSRKLSLSYTKPKNFPKLYLDETKMRQVIMNFIDNAIYYTPAGGKVEVQLSDKGETIECVIKDNGIGVPKAERHNLFSKFYRAGNARSARPDGTGLGLFMAKKVVVAQGGAIIFESEEGKGSTFGFTFSKDKLQTPPKAEGVTDKATTKS